MPRSTRAMSLVSASIRAMACSATAGAFRPTKLTTAMPRSLAASMFTFSKPARATITAFRFGPASRTAFGIGAKWTAITSASPTAPTISSGVGTASGPSCSMICCRWCCSSAFSPAQETSLTGPRSSPNSFSMALLNSSEERNRSPTQRTSIPLPPYWNTVYDFPEGGGHLHRVLRLPDVASEDDPFGTGFDRAPGGLHDVLLGAALRAAQGEHRDRAAFDHL